MSDWKEFERLKELPNLQDLLLGEARRRAFPPCYRPSPVSSLTTLSCHLNAVWSTVNTPLYHSHVDEKTGDETEWRTEVLKRLPTLKKLDGKAVTDDELEAAV